MFKSTSRFVLEVNTLSKLCVPALLGLSLLSLGCSEESSEAVGSKALAVSESVQQRPSGAPRGPAAPTVSGARVISEAVVRAFPTSAPKGSKGRFMEVNAPIHQIPPGMSGTAAERRSPPHTEPLLQAPGEASPAVDAQLEALAPLPAPRDSFLALPETGWIPPDTNGAVGPNHLMVVLNGAVAVQTRAGLTLTQTTLIEFFNAVNINFDVFDPLVRYDPFEDRWMIAAIADRAAPVSAIVLAVSQTGDPTGA